MEGHRFARPSRGGGLIPRATAGLDRWLSRQNPAYRPACQKALHHTDGVLFALFTLYCSLFTCHVQNTVASTIEEVGGGHWPPAFLHRNKRMSLQARTHTGVAPSRDSPWSQSVLPWLPLWGSCHEVTERVNIALSAFGTSPIGRGKAHIACRLSQLYSHLHFSKNRL